MHLLILGGNSDIGLAIARQFADKEDLSLTLASRNEEELKRNANNLSVRYDITVNWRHFDVRAHDSHHRFYEQLPTSPDGVVLAFGYNGDQHKAQSDITERKQIVETNFTGTVHLLEVIADDFEARANEYSSDDLPFIAGISSAAGERGRKSNYIYGSAKSGFTALLSGLRQRLEKSNVHVVTVKPGFVDTKMTADLDLPPLLTLSPKQVARATYKAVKRKRNVTYGSWYWWCIMSGIKLIPEFLFKKLNL